MEDNNVISTIQIWIEGENLILQPIHVLNTTDSTPYEPFTIPLENLTDEKVELRHDSFSNWKKYPVTTH
jgi:hypothetical protein